MNTVISSQLINQLNWRYATKKFDPTRKISPENWATLEEALVLSPSSFGLQPWKFLIVTNRATREQLVPFSWGQRQIVDASHLVVFATKKNLSEADIDGHLNRVAQVRGLPPESLATYRDMMIGSLIKGMDAASRAAWAARQTYIALGNFLTSAALLGIDACPMEGFQPDQYNEVLGLNEQGLTATVLATAGYRSNDDQYAGARKVRFPKQVVLLEV